MKEKKKIHSQKNPLPPNPLPLAFIAVLALIILAVAIFFYSPPAPASPLPSSSPQPALCKDGDTRPCSVGECGGVSTCAKGRWWGCRWNETCIPGTRAPCIEVACAYAVKVCNDCGTAYGPCMPP